MAVTGDLKFQEDERASWFSHKAETVKTYHYKVYLADYDTNVEVSPTERAAHFKFTFPDAEESFILLDAFSKGSMVKIIPEERIVSKRLQIQYIWGVPASGPIGLWKCLASGTS